jgi:hypothetical protein
MSIEGFASAIAAPLQRTCSIDVPAIAQLLPALFESLPKFTKAT